MTQFFAIIDCNGHCVATNSNPIQLLIDLRAEHDGPAPCFGDMIDFDTGAINLECVWEAIRIDCESHGLIVSELI